MPAKMTNRLTPPPIFALIPLDELKRRLPYSYEYLIDLMHGRKKYTAKFKETCLKYLTEYSEAQLFGGDSDG